VKQAKRNWLEPAEAQREATDQSCHITLKCVEDNFITIALPSDNCPLRFDIHDAEDVVILPKGASVRVTSHSDGLV
jgi:hypothetical protein